MKRFNIWKVIIFNKRLNQQFARKARRVTHPHPTTRNRSTSLVVLVFSFFFVLLYRISHSLLLVIDILSMKKGFSNPKKKREKN